MRIGGRLITAYQNNLLKNNGFKLNLHRAVFWNKDQKKIISFEFIQEKDILELISAIKSDPTDEWQFYFITSDTTDSMKRSIIEYLLKRG